MSTPAQKKLEEANKRLDEARAKSIAAQQKLGEIRKKRQDAEEDAAYLKREADPEHHMRAYENWANKKAPADGKPDFGGRKRRGRKTRRGRKSRSTRRR
jgi:hypothetical protein